LKTFKYP